MIKEKMGVPDGIDKQADEFKDFINEKIEKINFKELEKIDHGGEKLFYNLGTKKLNIKDFNSDIKVFLTLNEYNDLGGEKTIITSNGAGHTLKGDFKEDDIIYYPSKEGFIYLIEMVYDSNYTDKELEVSIIDNVKSINKSIIAHELMHFYDNYKEINANIYGKSEYDATKKMGNFPSILSKFAFMLYYNHFVENTVRPVEFFKEMQDKNITKEEFLDFFENSDIIKNVKKAKNFSYEKFKQEIENDKECKEFIERAFSDGYKSIGSLSEDVLNIFLINFINISMDTLTNYLKTDLEKIIIFEPKYIYIADRKFEKILRHYEKFHNNPNKYFEYLEKKLNLVGDKTFRKLSKLYDMAKDSDKSIIDWDLHTKINSKNEKIVYTMDFKSFKDRMKKK
jgi:hypothetical protein